MKQTAVEWLVYQLDLEFRFGNFKEIINQAKEMEKQQIVEAYGEGKTNGMDISHPLSLTKEISAEQYYNETFNK
jgi:hypothetical protein